MQKRILEIIRKLFVAMVITQFRLGISLSIHDGSGRASPVATWRLRRKKFDARERSLQKPITRPKGSRDPQLSGLNDELEYRLIDAASSTASIKDWLIAR